MCTWPPVLSYVATLLRVHVIAPNSKGFQWLPASALRVPPTNTGHQLCARQRTEERTSQARSISVAARTGTALCQAARWNAHPVCTWASPSFPHEGAPASLRGAVPARAGFILSSGRGRAGAGKRHGPPVSGPPPASCPRLKPWRIPQRGRLPGLTHRLTPPSARPTASRRGLGGLPGRTPEGPRSGRTG